MSDISYALPHTGKDITVPMVVLTDCHCRWHAQTWIWDYYRIFATWNPGVHATLTIIPCFGQEIVNFLHTVDDTSMIRSGAMTYPRRQPVML